MATSESTNLGLTIEDDDEAVSIAATADNFTAIDTAIGADRTRLTALESPTVTQAQTLANIETADTHATKWGKVKKAIAELIAHLGAGGSAHAAATTSTAGFMSAADKEKLDGMGATLPRIQRGVVQLTIDAGDWQKSGQIALSNFSDAPVVALTPIANVYAPKGLSAELGVVTSASIYFSVTCKNSLSATTRVDVHYIAIEA